MKAQMVAMAPLIAWKLTGSLLSKRVFFQILPHHVSSETSFHWPRCTPGITFCRQIMIPLSIISVTFKHLKHCNRTIVHYCCKCSPKKKKHHLLSCAIAAALFDLWSNPNILPRSTKHHIAGPLTSPHSAAGLRLLHFARWLAQSHQRAPSSHHPIAPAMGVMATWQP